MYVYTCEPDFGSMMTCIYTAWEKALKVGHDQVRLETEPVEQLTLFEEYIHGCISCTNSFIFSR